MSKKKEPVIEIDEFNGPLELLLTLLEKNAMDIWDVNISTVINQYLDYVKKMETDDLDIMSRFSVMAATLISIKAASIFPKEEENATDAEDSDPRVELAYQLIQYKMYKYISQELRNKEETAKKSFYRERRLPREVNEYEDKPDIKKMLNGMTIGDLKKIYLALLQQERERKDPVRSKFGKIKKEKVTLEDYQNRFREYTIKRTNFRFCEMLRETKTENDKIVAFLSLLEMAKQGEIHISQEKGEDILVTKT